MEYLALSPESQVVLYEGYRTTYRATYHLVKNIQTASQFVFSLASEVYRLSTHLFKGPETGYEGEPIPLTAIKTQEHEFYTRLY